MLTVTLKTTDREGVRREDDNIAESTTTAITKPEKMGKERTREKEI